MMVLPVVVNQFAPQTSLRARISQGALCFILLNSFVNCDQHGEERYISL